MFPPERLAYALQGAYDQEPTVVRDERESASRKTSWRAILLHICGSSTYEACRRRFIDEELYWNAEEEFARLACVMIQHYNEFEEQRQINLIDASFPSISILAQMWESRKSSASEGTATPVQSPSNSSSTPRQARLSPRRSRSTRTTRSKLPTTRSGTTKALPPSSRTRSKQKTVGTQNPSRVEKKQKVPKGRIQGSYR